MGQSSRTGRQRPRRMASPKVPLFRGNLVREKIKKTDDFTQAGEIYRSMSKTEMKHLVEDLVADLSHITNPVIQKRAIENLKKTDEWLGRSVALRLGLEN
jgi:catalase